MICLAAFAQLGVLHFHEIADVYAARKRRPGRKRAKGPMLQDGPMMAWSRTQLAKTCVSAPISQSRITQLGPMRTRSPSVTLPSRTTLTSSSTSRPTDDRSAYIEACRIDERDSRQHQIARPLLTVGRFDLRELHFIVDAEHLRFREREQRHHLEFSLGGNGRDIGEVELALGIVVLHQRRAISSEASPGAAMIPVFDSRMRSSCFDASLCSTILRMRPRASRRMRP